MPEPQQWAVLDSFAVLAVPDAWTDVNTIADLLQEARRRAEEGHPLRVATRYQNLVSRFLEEHGVTPYREPHLRATGYYAIFANIRGDSPEAVARRVFSQPDIGGLQGLTISRVYVRSGDPNWYAINIIVRFEDRSRSFEGVRKHSEAGRGYQNRDSPSHACRRFKAF